MRKLKERRQRAQRRALLCHQRRSRILRCTAPQSVCRGVSSGCRHGCVKVRPRPKGQKFAGAKLLSIAVVDHLDPPFGLRLKCNIVVLERSNSDPSWMSRCPLLVECQTSVSRGDSTDKGKWGAAVYRWNAALNQWTECHAVCRYSVANESRFSRRFTVSSGHF